MVNVNLFGNEILDPARNMKDYFILPPFSVLDTMGEVWQARKKRWKIITGDLALTKEGVLFKNSLTGNNTKIQQNMLDIGTSSEFDPVLAELIIKWFNVPEGKILDPFGGEQTKGVVAGELGCPYWACEFRREQVEVNNTFTAGYKNINYYCGDSNNISNIIKERGFDLCFTSPPYYDLEIYSKEDMSALGSYGEFMLQYKNIFSQCISMLKHNRFLVVKVGEIRDKKTGIYRNFVGDNIRIFLELGLHYYNEIILKNSVGTLPLRASKAMNTGRKIGKMHQNILVFFKGDVNTIRHNYPVIMPENKYYEQEI